MPLHGAIEQHPAKQEHMPLHGAIEQHPAKQERLTWYTTATMNNIIGSSKKTIRCGPYNQI